MKNVLHIAARMHNYDLRRNKFPLLRGEQNTAGGKNVAIFAISVCRTNTQINAAAPFGSCFILCSNRFFGFSTILNAYAVFRMFRPENTRCRTLYAFCAIF